MPAPIAISRVAASPFGQRLREWRAQRRLSQLELSLRSGVSTRHLSRAETGQVRPSREVIHTLAEVLDLPLRERNALLLAAGYAPLFSETTLESDDMAQVRQAIDLTLAGHEPFPAFALDGRWNILQANSATFRVFERIRPGGPKHRNIVRQALDPDDMRPYIENWDDVVRDLLAHLEAAALARPSDAALLELLHMARGAPRLPTPAAWGPAQPPSPILVAVFSAGDQRLRFFSTLTRLMSVRDAGLEEVGIECLHPADDATRRFCVALDDSGVPRS